jgi:tetrapyrrole methylase family protein/MazG family protein
MAGKVFLRTSSHPALASVDFQGDVEAFDDLYLEAESFEAVYQAIARRILDEAKAGSPVVYAVPGDPTIGEATTSLIRGGAAEAGIPVHIIHGVSFIEPCLAALEHDALDGLVIEDALTLVDRHHPSFPPDQAVIISQVHSQLIASDLKLTLLNQYPDDHPVVLLDGVGDASPSLQRLPLYQVDRDFEFTSRTCLFIEPMETGASFESFQELVAHLRSPEGCPWDREQTHLSLRKHMLEEAFEALEALDSEDPENLQEELGDLMLQLVLQTQIAAEQGEFLMAQVLADIHAKLVRRHPHVFGDVSVKDVPEVLTNWEGLKAAERQDEGGEKSALSGVPRSLPALAQADEYQSRAARLGFDWPQQNGVLAKIEEEFVEVAQAQGEIEQAAELGDLLFSIVNYCRWLGVDPEAALRQANGRFRSRFQRVEELAAARGQAVSDFAIDQLEAFWQQAKEESGS